MNFLKKVGMGILSMSLMASLCGCGKLSLSSTSELFKNSNAKDTDYDICFYNIVGEYEDELEDVIKQYESETGVKIRIVSTTSYDDYVDEVSTQVSDKSNFAILSVRGISELEKFVKDGMAIPLSSSKSEQLVKLVKDAPEKYLLKRGDDIYGIPIGVDAYSYFVDKNTVNDLVGASKSEQFIADMKAASYESFASFVQEADKYFQGQGVTDLNLNGRSYTLNSTKSERVKNISSTFSTVLYEETINACMQKSFTSQEAVSHASKDQISALNFIPASNALTLQSESVERGNASKDSFLKVLEDVTGSEDRDSFVPIPVKLDTQDSKLNSSICVGGYGYFVLNGKVSDRDQKLARDFLVWLCNYQGTSLGKFDKVCCAKSEVEKYNASGLVMNQLSFGMPYELMGYVAQYNLSLRDFSNYVKNKWWDLR